MNILNKIISDPFYRKDACFKLSLVSLHSIAKTLNGVTKKFPSSYYDTKDNKNAFYNNDRLYIVLTHLDLENFRNNCEYWVSNKDIYELRDGSSKICNYIKHQQNSEFNEAYEPVNMLINKKKMVLEYYYNMDHREYMIAMKFVTDNGVRTSTFFEEEWIEINMIINSINYQKFIETRTHIAKIQELIVKQEKYKEMEGKNNG
ncbi:hypothetical protein RJG79_08575 [Mycoplasmatota bacterium WC44]